MNDPRSEKTERVLQVRGEREGPETYSVFKNSTLKPQSFGPAEKIKKQEVTAALRIPTSKPIR